MVKRKLLAMLMAAMVLFTASIGSSMNVQAAENDVNVDSVTTFENFEQEAIEINSSFSGIKDKYVLTLSVFDWSTPCYWIHVRGTGSSSDMTYWKDLNMANLYIDPDTGKVIDIEWYNYFYENLNYRLTFTRPYTMKYYYPYWNGEEPKGGDD